MTYKLVVAAPEHVDYIVFDLDVDTDDEALLTLVAAGHLYHNKWVEVDHAVYEWESGQFKFAYDNFGHVVSRESFERLVEEANSQCKRCDTCRCNGEIER